jgi:hypothetical protein
MGISLYLFSSVRGNLSSLFKVIAPEGRRGLKGNLKESVYRCPVR